MRKCQKSWILLLWLSLYLVSCATSYSSNSTAAPTTVEEGFTQELNTQVAKIRVQKQYEWQFLNQYVNNVGWAPSSNQFVASFLDAVKMFDVNTFQEIWSISSTAPAYSASAPVFSPNGQRIFSYIRLRGPQVYDSQTGNLLTEAVPEYQSSCFKNDADGAVMGLDGHILFASVEDNRKKQVDFTEIQRWDPFSLQCDVLDRIEGHSRSIDISSDSKYLSASTGKGTSVSNNSLSEEGEIVVWNIETNEQVCSINNNGAFAHFKPLESRLLVANSSLDKLSYWDIETCTIVQEIEGVTTYYDFAFSPDGNMIALWDGGSISILHADSGKLLQKLDDLPLENAPLKYLQSYLAFSPDGHYLLSALNRDPLESLVILWSIQK